VSAASFHCILEADERRLIVELEFTTLATITRPFESSHLNAMLAVEPVAGNHVHQDGEGWASIAGSWC